MPEPLCKSIGRQRTTPCAAGIGPASICSAMIDAFPKAKMLFADSDTTPIVPIRLG